MYELKIYRGVMCHDSEEWCKNSRGIEHSEVSKICTLMGFKIWGKTDLRFPKWHEEFGKFSPEH